MGAYNAKPRQPTEPIKRTLLCAFFVAALLPSVALAQDRGLVAAIDALAENHYLPILTVALGTFSYDHSNLPTPFSRWLEDRIMQSASLYRRVKLVDRRAAAAMDPAFQALYAEFFKTTGTQALLYGRYYLEGGDVKVELRLSDLATATLVGSATLIIARASVPSGISVEPSAGELSRAQELVRLGIATPGGLQVSVSTDRGSGAAYRDGERLTVMLTVNKDAFVRLYHVDAAGRIQLIWPNPWDGGDGFLKAGQTATLPPKGEPFVFQLHPPYGLEFLKAVANTRPFTDAQAPFSPLGNDYKGVATRGLSVARPGQAAPEFAEALASFYISP